MERMRWLIFALISYCSALLNDTNKHPYTLESLIPFPLDLNLAVVCGPM